MSPLPINSSCGFALPMVMAMLMLGSLLTLNAWRDAWLAELRLQARSDDVRSRFIAEVVIQLALKDLLNTGPANSASAIRHQPGGPAQTHVFFPTTNTEIKELRLRLGSDECREGICAPLYPRLTPAAYWITHKSGCQTPILSSPDVWLSNSCYWIEIFLKENNTQADEWVYRITALSPSMRTSQPLVLQAIWLPDPNTKLAGLTLGRWISWRRLND